MKKNGHIVKLDSHFACDLDKINKSEANAACQVCISMKNEGNKRKNITGYK